MIQENTIKTTEEMMKTTSDTEVIRQGAAFEMIPPEQLERMKKTAEAAVLRPGAAFEMVPPEQTETKSATASEATVIQPGIELELIPPEQTETKSVTAAETAEAVIINSSAEKEIDAVSKKDEIVEIMLSSVVDDEDLNVEYIVKFSKKYMFEGNIIDEIDLSGLEDLSFNDSQEIDKIYKKIAKSYTSTPDLTDEYALAAAAVVTGKPIEFFTRISMKDIKRIRNRVIGFLYITD